MFKECNIYYIYLLQLVHVHEMYRFKIEALLMPPGHGNQEIQNIILIAITVWQAMDFILCLALPTLSVVSGQHIAVRALACA